MAISSGTVANLSVTAASIVLITLGGLRIRETALRSSPDTLPNVAVSDFDATFSINGATALGESATSITLVEFSDYECPFCARFFNDTFEPLKREFIDTKQIRYAVMNLPLESHPFAKGASEAAECAGQQGQFWQMRAKLFAMPSSISPADLRTYAQDLGLQIPEFADCSAGELAEQIGQQVEEARKLEIRNTPTFVLGRVDATGRVSAIKRIVGAQPIQVFRDAITEVLGRS